MHRKSLSSTFVGKKHIKVDDLITRCEETKKEISSDVQKINKQFLYQRKGWKKISQNLSNNSISKNSKILTVSEEIHQKFKEIYETQINDKAQRLSKYLIYKKNEVINDSDLSNQEIVRFFSNNKREFGLPLKFISYFPKKKKMRIKSFGGTVDPEETILQDIQAFMSKNSKSRVTPSKGNNFEKSLTEESEVNIKDLSLRNQIALKEMKKLKPIYNSSFFTRKNEALKSIHNKLSQSTVFIKHRPI